ncbi:MAG: T9SS type A sorting domain-containing protein [Crocinitomicaceae bacterium]|jgi:hypothetical protein|tara:strand:- start:22350 stop:23312 length:963 start_codon:yes stop_codon:yes gene_type:complete
MNNTNGYFLTLSLVMLSFTHSELTFGQSYAPEPGAAGSTAIHKDSLAIARWADQVTVNRGYKDIQQPELGLTDYGQDLDATGIADNMVVSLGDGGSAIANFSNPIQNEDGPDFAVFENGFSDHYMELAYVEVSSNGIDYTRFQSISEIPNDIQIDNFTFSDCRYVNNLAGKYRVYYGTPFDLSDLEGSPGLDLNHIISIRIIDVVGCIAPTFSSYDSEGNTINDPYPTNFDSGGFDLDAIGIMNSLDLSIEENKFKAGVFPNPVKDILYLKGFTNEEKHIVNPMGALVLDFYGDRAHVGQLRPGVYYLKQASKIIKFIKN